jgi:hypothetical protein
LFEIGFLCVFLFYFFAILNDLPSMKLKFFIESQDQDRYYVNSGKRPKSRLFSATREEAQAIEKEALDRGYPEQRPTLALETIYQLLDQMATHPVRHLCDLFTFAFDSFFSFFSFGFLSTN